MLLLRPQISSLITIRAILFAKGIRMLNTIRSHAAAGVAAVVLWSVGFMADIASAGIFPYVNDFSTTGLTNADTGFALDTNAGVLNYANGAGTFVNTSTEPITGIGTSNFVVSSKFVLTNAAGTGNLGTMGFGIFGTSGLLLSAGADSFYLADWGVTNATNGAWGQLRILSLGNTADFTAVNGDSDGTGANGSSVVPGNTYEMKLTGTYSSGTLNMTLALFDGSGVQLGTTATGSDTTPLTGQYFGFRDRVAGANHAAALSYDYFKVTAPVTAHAGDFDSDGDVDGADFVAWQTNFPKESGAVLAQGDADADGDVDGADFVVWQTNFPFTPGPGAAPVPEPNVLVLGAIGALGLGWQARWRRRNQCRKSSPAEVCYRLRAP
jgi:hypothetical protein